MVKIQYHNKWPYPASSSPGTVTIKKEKKIMQRQTTVIKPQDITKASRKEVYLQCPFCNKIFKKKIINITRANRNYCCPNCKNKLYRC